MTFDDLEILAEEVLGEMEKDAASFGPDGRAGRHSFSPDNLRGSYTSASGSRAPVATAPAHGRKGTERVHSSSFPQGAPIGETGKPWSPKQEKLDNATAAVTQGGSPEAQKDLKDKLKEKRQAKGKPKIKKPVTPGDAAIETAKPFHERAWQATKDWHSKGVNEVKEGLGAVHGPKMSGGMRVKSLAKGLGRFAPHAAVGGLALYGAGKAIGGKEHRASIDLEMLAQEVLNDLEG